ncbi:MAG: phosphoserine phosphatase [Candidatus Thorarchaeota archaeon]|nr:MAG: phosphoserine phosphatase [Candidatus Thorarchaeota archaeon]
MTIKLVVFDVDGTLTRHTSIWWRLHEVFGTQEEGRVFFDKYFAGEITYRQWANSDASLWKGKSLSRVMEIVRTTELVPGAKETVSALKKMGINVAILSGGVDLLADDVAARVGIDYVMTNKLRHTNGMLTGEVEVLVEWGRKVRHIKQVADHFAVSLKETAFVGDGLNDISVFRRVGLSIAFRPERQEVADAAQAVVRDDDLRGILDFVH